MIKSLAFRHAVAVSVVVTTVLIPATATACPNCKEALANQVAFAFAASIFFLMSMPFSILAAWLVMARRLSDRQD